MKGLVNAVKSFIGKMKGSSNNNFITSTMRKINTYYTPEIFGSVNAKCYMGPTYKL